MPRQRFGCTSVVAAVNLQFELAGHGLYTDLRRSKGGVWLCDLVVKRPEVRTMTPFKSQWMKQIPRGLCQCNQGRLPCDCRGYLA